MRRFVWGAAICLTGCTVSPYDGQRLANESTPFEAWGYTDDANEEIHVEAALPGTLAPDFDGPEWETLTTARSSLSQSGPLTSDGQQGYRWRRPSVTVPSRFWQPTFETTPRGHRTFVRSVARASSGGILHSLYHGNEDWGCLGRVGNDFVRYGNECTGPGRWYGQIHTGDISCGFDPNLTVNSTGLRFQYRYSRRAMAFVTASLTANEANLRVTQMTVSEPGGSRFSAVSRTRRAEDVVDWEGEASLSAMSEGECKLFNRRSPLADGRDRFDLYCAFDPRPFEGSLCEGNPRTLEVSLRYSVGGQGTTCSTTRWIPGPTVSSAKAWASSAGREVYCESLVEPPPPDDPPPPPAEMARRLEADCYCDQRPQTRPSDEPSRASLSSVGCLLPGERAEARATLTCSRLAGFGTAPNGVPVTYSNCRLRSPTSFRVTSRSCM